MPNIHCNARFTTQLTVLFWVTVHNLNRTLQISKMMTFLEKCSMKISIVLSFVQCSCQRTYFLYETILEIHNIKFQNYNFILERSINMPFQKSSAYCQELLV